MLYLLKAFLFFVFSTYAWGQTTLIITDLYKTVQLTSRIIRATQHISLFNPTKTDAQYFYIAFPEDEARNLGAAYVVPSNKITTVNLIKPDEFQLRKDFKSFVNTKEHIFYIVPIPVPSNTTINFQLITLLGHQLKPEIPSIPFHHPHVVMTKQRSTVYSPYRVKQQQTTFIIPLGSLKSAQGVGIINGTAFETETILDSPPFTDGLLNVQISFDLNNHLGYFPKVHRKFEISHWSHVAVKEEYEFFNEAASLSEEFSRGLISEYTGTLIGRVRNKPYPIHRTCFQLESVLPPAAKSVEYYDAIGNISSSHVSKEKDKVVVTIEPRFLVLGGWKADWILEHVVPLQAVVSIPHSGSHQYTLTVPLGPGFKSIYTDLLTIQIVLPPRATDISVTTPRLLNGDVHISETYGWLDIFSSRPVINLEVKGFAMFTKYLLSHNLQIHYSTKAGMWGKPLQCCGIGFVGFLVTLLLIKSKLRIGPSKFDEGTITESEATKTICQLGKTIFQLNKEWGLLCRSQDPTTSIKKIRWHAEVNRLLRHLAECSHEAQISYTTSIQYQEFAKAVTSTATRAVEELEFEYTPTAENDVDANAQLFRLIENASRLLPYSDKKND